MLDFVMKVDLSYFFADARRNSLVLVDDSWTKVKELEIHIENLFKLSKISLMTEDGYYLPSLESIKVIKSAQCLKVFKFEDFNSLNINNCQSYERASMPTKKRKSRSDATEIFYSTPNFSKGNKRKNEPADTLNDSAKKAAKKHKSKSQVDEFRIDVNVSNGLADNNLPDTPQYSPPTPSWTSQSEQPQEMLPIADKADTAEESVNNINQSLPLPVADQEGSVTEETVNKKITEQYKTDTTLVGANGHKVNQVEFYCALMSIESTPVRTFKLPPKNEVIKILENIVIHAPAAYKGESKPEESFQSQSCKDSDELKIEAATQVVELKLIESDSENEVVLLDDDADDSDVEVQELLPKMPDALDLISKMLRNAVILDKLPEMGDTVICKLPKNKNSPELYPCTDYVAGICAYINRRTRFITMEIIAYSKSSKQILRQYASNSDSSNNSELIISVNFKDLVEPKLCVPN